MPIAKIPDHEIRYRVYGEPTDRPPLVAIHGAAAGLYVWLEQRPLARDRQLVLFDLPGHGRSTPEPATVDMPTYAGHVVALADALGLERFVPMGHSMGGAVALTLALDHAERIPAVVLAATGARLPVSELVFGAIEGAFEQLGDLIGQIGYSPTADPRLVKRYTTGPLQTSQRMARDDFRACEAFDVRDRLVDVAPPTLILAGEADPLIGMGRIRQLEGGIADSRVISWPDTGHMLMQERGAETNEAVAAFLSTLSAA